MEPLKLIQPILREKALATPEGSCRNHMVHPCTPAGVLKNTHTHSTHTQTVLPQAAFGSLMQIRVILIP